jgi:hypothetical protein
MEEAEGTAIHRRTRITLHNKNIMVIQEEAGECLRRIEGEAPQDQRKDRQRLIGSEVVMTREEVVKVEDIQTGAHRLEEEVVLHHWSGRLLQILDVSGIKEILGFMLIIHSERTIRTARTARTTWTTKAIENATYISRSDSVG